MLLVSSRVRRIFEDNLYDCLYSDTLSEWIGLYLDGLRLESSMTSTVQRFCTDVATDH